MQAIPNQDGTKQSPSQEAVVSIEYTADAAPTSTTTCTFSGIFAHAATHACALCVLLYSTALHTSFLWTVREWISMQIYWTKSEEVDKDQVSQQQISYLYLWNHRDFHFQKQLLLCTMLWLVFLIGLHTIRYILLLQVVTWWRPAQSGQNVPTSITCHVKSYYERVNRMWNIGVA